MRSNGSSAMLRVWQVLLLVALIAVNAVLFALAYVAFMRQEVRA